MDLKEIEKKSAEFKDDLRNQLQRGLADNLSNETDEPRGFQGSGFLYGDEPPKLKEEEYLQSAVGWVYAAVSAIADAVMKLKLRLYKVDANGDIKEVTAHNSLDLLYRVNKFQTFDDHMWLTQQYLELAGEAPWFMDRGDSGTGEPQNIMLLRPDRLLIKKSDSGMLNPISGYTYKLDGTRTLDIKPEELIYLRFPDPTNPWRGKGTLQAAATTVDIDNFSEEYNRKFFFNGARPDSVFTTKNKLTAVQRTTIRSDISRLYKGMKNAQKVALLEDGLEWKPMAINGKDMEFMEQQRFSMSKILSIFRVPKTIVSITEDVNLANAKTGEYVFAKWTIKPKMQRLVAQLNEFYLPMFAGTQTMFLSFDDPVPQDIETDLKRFENALKYGYMTYNEIRSELNLQDVGPDGDQLLVPSNVTPLAQAGQTFSPFGLSVKRSKKESFTKGIIERSGSGYYKAFRVAKAVHKAQKQVDKFEGKFEQIVKNKVTGLIKQRRAKEKLKRKELLDERKDFVNQTLKSGDRFEQSFSKTTSLIFANQKEKVLALFPKTRSKKTDITIDNYLLDPDDETQVMIRIYDPMVKQVIKEQGARAAYLIGQGKSAFDMASKPVQRYLKNRVYDFSFEVNKETNKQLAKTLAEGVAKGESILELKARVSETFDSFEGYRSERIARSEVVRASNFASNEAYKQSGVVSKVEWMATEDGKTCEWCGPLDGKSIDLGGNFFQQGDEFVGKDGGVLNLDYSNIEVPPLHSNCRCTIVPVIS